MSTEHASFPLFVQRHKTESLLVNNAREGLAPLPAITNGVNGERRSGASTSTLASNSDLDPARDRQENVNANGNVNFVVLNGTRGLFGSTAPAGPPPPYSVEPRRARRSAAQSVSTDSDQDSDEADNAQEATPLLGGRSRGRSRAASYVAL